MKAEVGFYKDQAILAAGALAEEVNKRFGDSIDPKACALVVKRFIEMGIELQCRNCGWRKAGTEFCTQKQCVTGNTQTCELFRHVLTVEN